MDLAVGALDHPERMKPVAHVGVESRVAAFHDVGPEEKKISDFEHIVKKWQKAYGSDATPGDFGSSAPKK